jgi:hypothetical protein
MSELVGAVLALVMVACVSVLVAYAAFMTVATASTIRRAKSDWRLSADLDRVLDEILAYVPMAPGTTHTTDESWQHGGQPEI